MSRDELTLHDYVGHILTAVERIKRYTEGMDEAAFISDELIQDAVVRNIEVIGEASRNIGRHFPEFVAKHPDIPLRPAYEMRNALAHGYHHIDLSIVWNTISEDLPALGKQLEPLAATLKRSI
jgi:uncharacterized protein with HEPN domain